MPNDISRSHEGKDQKSDQSQTGDVSPNRKPFHVIRQEATLHDQQQRGVGGQAHELEQVRKGKMLALTDGKDDKPTSGNSHFTEKIILPDKSGLRGGGNEMSKRTVSSLHRSERQIGRDVAQLVETHYARRERKKAERRQKEFDEFVAGLDKVTLDEFKASTSSGTRKEFDELLADLDDKFKASTSSGTRKEFDEFVTGLDDKFKASTSSGTRGPDVSQ
jgi:hypothetical protein